MSPDQPYIQLPDRIELTLAEAGELREVLDLAVASATTDSQRSAARQAADVLSQRHPPSPDTSLPAPRQRQGGTVHPDTMLREWAYAATYQSSDPRGVAMQSWLDHYNHRPARNQP